MKNPEVTEISVQRILERTGHRVITMERDTAITKVMAILAERAIGAVPVVDHDGMLVGILSERDVIRHLGTRGADALQATAADLMTARVITCRHDTSVEDVLAMMSAHRIRHVPVLREGRLVGLVSVRDVLDLQREMLLGANRILEARVEERTRKLAREVAEHMRTRGDVEVANATLQHHIAEIEDTKARLEIQGIELVGLSEELYVTREQLAAANTIKTAFLSNMSHELRTPLNAIMGMSQIMANEQFGPIGTDKYREYSNDILNSSEHLLCLVNDLLDIEKIESGHEELHEEPIIVTDLLNGALRIVEAHAGDRSIRLSIEAGNDRHRLFADAMKVKQVVINLLTNAIKFSHPGGQVTIRAWSDDQRGYAIEIADHGIGIAPGDIAKALSKFGQIHDRREGARHGSGLGLPLSKGLVELHGGSFTLESQPGRGTTVTIGFPPSRLRGSGADRRQIA